ncbi:K+ Transporter [Blattamonas nauphoetae]|uniref:K+ Transporter n=1 Tax=Blattamonas nauphoetae TaxID=2049346 RepID=A0ABQ9YG37_9EUKA|nr:K+ Transporter [Blattamonas nauphoetae]
MSQSTSNYLIGNLPNFNENKKVVKVGDQYLVEENPTSKPNRFLSFISRHTSYFTYHFSYFLISTLIMSGFLKLSSRSTSYVDCLLTAASGLTSTGITSISLQSSSFTTQLLIVLCMLGGCATIVSIVPVIARMIYISRHFNQPVMKKTIDQEIHGEYPPDSVSDDTQIDTTTRPQTIRKTPAELEALKKQLSYLAPSPVLTIQLPKQSMASRTNLALSNLTLSSSSASLPPAVTPMMTFDPRYGQTRQVKRSKSRAMMNDPTARPRATDILRPPSQQQITPSGTSQIIPASQTAVDAAANNDYPQNIQFTAQPGTVQSQPKNVLHIKRAAPNRKYRTSQSATLTPEAASTLISAIETIQRPSTAPRNSQLDSSPTSTHQLTVSSLSHLYPPQDDGKQVVAEIRNTGYVAPATHTEDEEKGSIPLYYFSLEYQAMKSIVKAMIAYVLLWIVVLTLLFSIYIISVPSARSIVGKDMMQAWGLKTTSKQAESYGSVLWFSFVLAVASFTSGGLVCDDSSLMNLHNNYHYFISIFSCIGILAGAPGFFPVPFSIWIRFLRRVSRKRSAKAKQKNENEQTEANQNSNSNASLPSVQSRSHDNHEDEDELGQMLVWNYVLEHSRKIYTGLFGTIESIVLTVAYLSICLVEFVLLAILDIVEGNTLETTRFGRILALFCQSISNRCGGISFVDIGSLHSGSITLLCLTMLVSIYPFTLTLHATTVPMDDEEVQEQIEAEVNTALDADRVREKKRKRRKKRRRERRGKKDAFDEWSDTSTTTSSDDTVVPVHHNFHLSEIPSLEEHLEKQRLQKEQKRLAKMSRQRRDRKRKRLVQMDSKASRQSSSEHPNSVNTIGGLGESQGPFRHSMSSLQQERPGVNSPFVGSLDVVEEDDGTLWRTGGTKVAGGEAERAQQELPQTPTQPAHVQFGLQPSEMTISSSRTRTDSPLSSRSRGQLQTHNSDTLRKDQWSKSDLAKLFASPSQDVSDRRRQQSQYSSSFQTRKAIPIKPGAGHASLLYQTRATQSKRKSDKFLTKRRRIMPIIVPTIEAEDGDNWNDAVYDTIQKAPTRNMMLNMLTFNSDMASDDQLTTFDQRFFTPTRGRDGRNSASLPTSQMAVSMHVFPTSDMTQAVSPPLLFPENAHTIQHFSSPADTLIPIPESPPQSQTPLRPPSTSVEKELKTQTETPADVQKEQSLASPDPLRSPPAAPLPTHQRSHSSSDQLTAPRSATPVQPASKPFSRPPVYPTQPEPTLHVSSDDDLVTKADDPDDTTTPLVRSPVEANSDGDNEHPDAVEEKPSFLTRHPVLLAFYRLLQDLGETQQNQPLLRDVLWMFLAWVVLIVSEARRVDDVTANVTPLKVLFEVSSAYGTVGLSTGAVAPTNLSLSFCASLNVFSRLVLTFLMLLGKHREMPTSIDRSISVSSFKGAPEEVLQLLPWNELRKMKLTQAKKRRGRKTRMQKSQSEVIKSLTPPATSSSEMMTVPDVEAQNFMTVAGISDEFRRVLTKDHAPHPSRPLTAEDLMLPSVPPSQESPTNTLTSGEGIALAMVVQPTTNQNAAPELTPLNQTQDSFFELSSTIGHLKEADADDQSDFDDDPLATVPLVPGDGDDDDGLSEDTLHAGEFEEHRPSSPAPGTSPTSPGRQKSRVFEIPASRSLVSLLSGTQSPGLIPSTSFHHVSSMERISTPSEGEHHDSPATGVDALMNLFVPPQLSHSEPPRPHSATQPLTESPRPGSMPLQNNNLVDEDERFFDS